MRDFKKADQRSTNFSISSFWKRLVPILITTNSLVLLSFDICSFQTIHLPFSVNSSSLSSDRHVIHIYCDAPITTMLTCLHRIYFETRLAVAVLQPGPTRHLPCVAPSPLASDPFTLLLLAVLLDIFSHKWGSFLLNHQPVFSSRHYS